MDVLLETARLRLRRFTMDDVDRLFELDGDPEVMRFLTGGAGTPRARIAEKMLPAMIEAYETYGGLGWFAAEGRASGEFLGWFGLHPLEDAPSGELELGYRLRKSAWGTGLATEGSRALLELGFGRFGAVRVIAQTYEENAASRRVMEKLGMTFVRAFRVAPEELSSATYDAAAGEAFPGEDVEYELTREAWEAARNL